MHKFTLFQTANSKGYAFILYENEEVARIVATTMNDYILCGRLLKCVYFSSRACHFPLSVTQFVGTLSQRQAP